MTESARRRTAALCAVLIAVLLASIGIRAGAHSGAGASMQPGNDAAVAAVGKAIFFDRSLSASGRISCATCHSPKFAYGPPDGRAVQPGGAHLTAFGTRAVPSLRYTLNRTPIWFHEQAVSLGERLIENEPPAGGFTADGRFDRLRDQAAFPLLAANEMANPNPAAVVAKLAAAPYAPALRAAFGANVFAGVAGAFAAARYALERFQLTDASFHPYTSKYDAYLDGLATLTPAESRGKKLFDDTQHAGCEICHPDLKGANGAHPLFTDYQFEALGVPRNMEIPANHDPRYDDLGLCGPLRTDKRSVAKYCGLFKTPSLRNVATRRVFFHNGRFHTLRDALRFYVERDTDPQKWYPAGPHGTIETYNDVPARYRSNVDTVDAPLTQTRGRRPIWNERDIDDVIAFLRTLDDGYSKQSHRGGQD